MPLDYLVMSPYYMSMLTTGFNHVGILTEDTDRFVEFYGEVFGAELLHKEETPFGHFSLVSVGGVGTFNVFEVDDREADGEIPMFQRGRLDHLGLQAGSLEDFNECRRRLIERGATDGFVTDFGVVWSCCFTDPDGLEAEIVVDSPNPGPSRPPGTPAPGY